ncbi:hypothetical protein M885DRAFT_618245 [Pelagophyceae sp. CCMP2097]|nr:hypothetical protein M885DRAFT_618245 [Pelagophyceae sp. CCMP2097]
MSPLRWVVCALAAAMPAHAMRPHWWRASTERPGHEAPKPRAVDTVALAGAGCAACVAAAGVAAAARGAVAGHVGVALLALSRAADTLLTVDTVERKVETVVGKRRGETAFQGTWRRPTAREMLARGLAATALICVAGDVFSARAHSTGLAILAFSDLHALLTALFRGQPLRGVFDGTPLQRFGRAGTAFNEWLSTPTVGLCVAGAALVACGFVVANDVGNAAGAATAILATTAGLKQIPRMRAALAQRNGHLD